MITKYTRGKDFRELLLCSAQVDNVRLLKLLNYKRIWVLIPGTIGSQGFLAGSDTITFSFEKIILAEYKEFLNDLDCLEGEQK